MGETRPAIADAKVFNSSSRPKIFGPAPLLPGEDTAAYDELLVQASSLVRPADLIEQIWLEDFIDWVWQTQRLRRFREGELAAALRRELQGTILKSSELTEDETDDLIGRWRAQQSGSMEQVELILSIANLTFEVVFAKAFRDVIHVLERIDRLIATAEARRNAVLREMERRRASLAGASREAVRQFESAETEAHSFPAQHGSKGSK